tara:strand:+ start:323 stop:2050 length:1728 start_codon:yes stop_codon:yes gene_type:complete
MSVGNLLYQKLVENGVKCAWIYSGGAVMPLVDAFYDKAIIKYYINTHEQHAGHSATGYAKSTQKPGVVLVTSGPGLTNMITPILDATNDSTPLVVISGQVSLKSMGTQAFQECPAVDLTKYITKWSYTVRAVNELPIVIDTAFKIAMSGRKGAVHIDIPKCIAASMFCNSQEDNLDHKFKYVIDKYLQPTPGNALGTVEAVMETINQSSSPVLYCGAGCNDYAGLIQTFAESANIHVTTTLHAMGLVPEDHPLSLKMLGMHGSAYANFAIQNSDCIIALGSRFDDRTTGNLKYYAPKATSIIHVNVNNQDMENSLNTTKLHASVGDFLEKAIPFAAYRKRAIWNAQIKQWKNKYPFDYEKPVGDKIKTQCAIMALEQHTSKKENVIFTTGVGNHQMFACQYITWKRPRQILSSGSLGVMGSSMGYAIGAQIANPQSTVISIDGDGSFNMSISELQTISRYQLPIKIALMNDGCLSMVSTWEKLFFNSRHVATSDLCNPNYKDICRAYGITHMLCDSKQMMGQITSDFMSHKGPVVCEFRVESDVCLPLVKPGCALDDMLLYGKETAHLDISHIPS